jgi:hypothetical protein
MTDRIRCDASDWEFSVGQDGRELVARLYFRGERFGPVFKARTERELRRAVASYLLSMSDEPQGRAH